MDSVRKRYEYCGLRIARSADEELATDSSGWRRLRDRADSLGPRESIVASNLVRAPFRERTIRTMDLSERMVELIALRAYGRQSDATSRSVGEALPSNISTFRSVVREALARGLEIHRPVAIACTSEGYITEDLLGHRKTIVLPSSGTVYPICQVGRNRSQLLREAVLTTRPSEALKVSLTQGGQLGTDPWFATLPESGSLRLYRYCRIRRDCPVFEAVTGSRRNYRVGEQQHQKALEEGRFEEVRRWMNENYYEKILREGGHLIIAHSTGSRIILSRLVEVAREKGLRMDRVHIWRLLVGDPLSGNRSSSRKIARGKELFRLFKTIIRYTSN